MTSRRVTIAASEVLGMAGTGGAATADSLLAIALARRGHSVELLVAPGRDAGPLAEPWAGIYTAAGVRVRHLEARRVVRPGYLAPTLAILDAVRESEPDVLVADDWRGLAWASLRARQLTGALAGTAVALYCHGPARMLAEFARKVPDTLPRFGEEIAERAALTLADAAVSPSAWLFDWERERGWPAPARRHVVPCLWRSVALGEPPEQATTGVRIRRLAFFGQLREGKGVRIFLASLETLGGLLDGVEIVFLGRETPRWTADRVRASLAPATLARLAALRFETGLDPTAAIAELSAPGTLAVIPSLLDNSPYTVSECLEHGIPFVAARTGGIPELVSEADHDRVLFEPQESALTSALHRALEQADGLAPARPGFDPGSALAAWLELVESLEHRPSERAPRATEVTVVGTRGWPAAQHPLASGAEVEVVEAESRAAGLERASGEWVVFLDGGDEPHATLLSALVDAQAESGADVVTTAVRPADTADGIQLFLGDPGALGLVENQYGVVALVRRELLRPEDLAEGARDPDWPMLAALALRGARIVSIPDAHSTHRGRPGTIADVPGEGLTVLRLFETAERSPNGATQLAATLAAAVLRDARRPARPDEEGRGGLARRVARLLRRDGVSGVVRLTRDRVMPRRAGRRPRSLTPSLRTRIANFRDPRPPLHVLHPGKTGGTALRHTLLPLVDVTTYRLVFHGHAVRLRDIPPGEKIFFVVRDPISRFVSAFNGRRREDRPRYHYPWTEGERRAFETFATPEQLAVALSSRDAAERERAVEAMRSIGHIDTMYGFWFGDEEELGRRSSDILLIGFQERLDEDFETLRRLLGLPEGTRLPAGHTPAHRTTGDFDTRLGDVARANLEHWYERDLAFVSLCRRLAGHDGGGSR